MSENTSSEVHQGVERMSQKRYRKVATITAEQFWPDRKPWPEGVVEEAVGGVGWCIETLEGRHIVRPGDWIAQGVKGERWPIKPDVFEASYVEDGGDHKELFRILQCGDCGGWWISDGTQRDCHCREIRALRHEIWRLRDAVRVAKDLLADRHDDGPTCRFNNPEADGQCFACYAQEQIAEALTDNLGTEEQEQDDG